jgi:serine/threonine-protein kinase
MRRPPEADGTSAPDGRIDRYEILAELGRGATGVVYKACDPELDRLVALKTLQPARELPAEQCGQLERRLRSEAVTVARLNHPNIVAIHDVVIWHGTPCIVMEYVDGGTLAHLMAGGPLVPDEAIHIGLQMCHALEYAHALRVIHRDIKPGNILVSETSMAKLGDFSIVQLTGQGGAETGVMVGTPGYIAPEQVTDGTADARSDIFSLGVVLYEAVSGVRAFPGSDLASVLYDIAHVEVCSPRELNGAVTPALAAVIRQAMSKRPDRRYQSAQALAEALARARDLGGSATRAGAFLTARRAVTVGLACLVVAGSAGGASEAWRRVGPPTGRSGEAGGVIEAPAHPGSKSPNEVHRAGDVLRSIPPPERAGRRSVESRAHDAREAAARAESAVTSQRAPGTLTTAPPIKRYGCLSVNAVPFATVLVDGQSLGETPAACLRVDVGEHRVQLQQEGERSPERVVRVGEQHTVENPVRLSYDFQSRQFRE